MEAAPAERADTTADRKAKKREEAQARQRLADARKPLATRQAKLESEIEALGKQKQEIDAWLATEDAYAADAKDALKERIARQGEIAWQLARFESEWIELAEKLEKIASAS